MEIPYPAAGFPAENPPFPLVLPPRNRLFAYLGPLAAGLLLCACTSEEGPEYDIPAGQRILGAQMETDADGNPIILAEVGMYYGTREKLEAWEQKYILANSQTILFSKRNGAWTEHPFRNLQNQYGARALLARNASGAVQPLVWDRRKLTLYGRAGEDWVPRAISRLADDGRYYSLASGYGSGASLALTGDSAWETVVYSTSNDHLRLGRSDGTFLDLDSAGGFQPRAYYSGRDFNMVVGTRNNFRYSEAGAAPEPPVLTAYRWSHDPEHPNLKQQVIPGYVDSYTAYAAFFVAVEGEERFYALQTDSLHEFALRGDSLEYLGMRYSGGTPAGSAKAAPFHIGSVFPDPKGCFHGITQVYPVLRSSPDSSPDYGAKPLLLHSSSCAPVPDTLALPAELKDVEGYPMLSSLRFTAEGSPMLLLTLLESYGGFPDPSQIGQPGWVYLATRNPSGKWEWERVAKY